MMPASALEEKLLPEKWMTEVLAGSAVRGKDMPPRHYYNEHKCYNYHYYNNNYYYYCYYYYN